MNCANIFDWLKQINNFKSPVDSFTESDWEVFNAYMVHRFLSMNPDFLELVNEVQVLPPTEKKKIYSIYKEYIPKNNKWNKYIKSSVKQRNKELLQYLKDYFEVSIREVKDYLKILDNTDISRILTSIGIDNKEIKTLIK
tara:strand:- start:8457 stop:8876 length:420 start_codon:yes stop_codon:yes gene_type:complete